MSNISTSINWFELVFILYLRVPVGQFEPVFSRQNNLSRKVEPVRREDSLWSYNNCMYHNYMFGAFFQAITESFVHAILRVLPLSYLPDPVIYILLHILLVIALSVNARP